MSIYNKLLRYHIPKIIQHDGKECVTRTLNDLDYITEGNKKMHEELTENETAEIADDAVDELAMQLRVSMSRLLMS